jgi:hypothetical protein
MELDSQPEVFLKPSNRRLLKTTLAFYGSCYQRFNLSRT